MKRTGLTRRTPLRRSSFRSARAPRPMAARSALARVSDRELTRAHQVVKDRDGHCVLCDSPGEQVHHRLPRGAGGALHDPTRHAPSRLVWLCADHHRWAESYRSMAESIGIVVRRGVTSCRDVPVFHHKRWVFLDDHGCVVPADPVGA